MTKKAFNFKDINGMLSRDEMRKIRGGYTYCAVCCAGGGTYLVGNCSGSTQSSTCSGHGGVGNMGGYSCECG